MKRPFDGSLRVRSHHEHVRPTWRHNVPVPSRRLFVLRHAKSAAATLGPRDHDRPLAPRGRRALPVAAAEIDRHLDAPLDLVLASTALRVRETLAGVLPLIADPVAVRYERALYLAGLDDLFATVRSAPAEVGTLLLCGHNPGLHQLALSLVGDATPEALRDNLPTAGLVVIDLDAEWPSVGEGDGRLVAFSVPPHG